MIQRIQSVYLFLAFVAIVLFFFFPVATFISDMLYLKFWVTGVVNPAPGGTVQYPESYNLPLAIAVGAISLLSIVTIFLFRNRQKQMQFTNIAVMLNILVVLAVLFIYLPLVERKTGISPDFTGGKIGRAHV